MKTVLHLYFFLEILQVQDFFFELESSTLYTCPSLKSFWILDKYRHKNSVGYSAYFFFLIWAFLKHANVHLPIEA